MARILYALLVLTVLAPILTEGQNYPRMCQQLLTNCQACEVFKSECTSKPQKPQRPSSPPPTTTVSKPVVPGTPVSPVDADQVVCFGNGKLCDKNTDCCSKNCVLVYIDMGGEGHYFTQRVCRVRDNSPSLK